MTALAIGTRKSVMAVKQTNAVIAALREKFPDATFEMNAIDTSGDRDQVSRLGKHGGKGGAFVNELRDLLEKGEVRMLMHSLKDLPGNEEYYKVEEKFRIGAFMRREDPRDCLVLAPGRALEQVLRSGVIGTNAIRRKAYLRHHYRGVQVVHSRGAVLGREGRKGRIEKLDGGIGQEMPYGNTSPPADALVLAKSGLERLGLAQRISKVFEVDEMCPAIGQGVVVVEYLAGDTEARRYLGAINDEITEKRCLAERSMLRALNGHCDSPIAGHAWVSGGRLRLRGAVIFPDGRHLSEAEDSTDIADPEDLGIRVAQELQRRGADQIIALTRHLD